MTASWDTGSLPFSCQWEEEKIPKAVLEVVGREARIDIHMKTKTKTQKKNPKTNKKNPFLQREMVESTGW